MSRMPRPLGRRSGTAALLAILAITTGWNVPPPRPGVAAYRTVDLMAARERLTARIAVRATAWVAAWDRRSSDPTLGVEHAGAGEAPPARRSATPATAHPGVLGPSGKALAVRGRNHFWMPAIGMSSDVVAFPCPRQRPPDHFVYRWGCSGRNNVYILGHAVSVMRPLHDAYAQGRLKVGMIAMYADGAGRIRAYRVTEWRVVDASTGVWWAVADQAVPSMTLQTCFGSRSQWRLNVRLVAVD